MATLKDVAEKAGITVTTVSRVLNNRGYIGQATREKVYRVMKELNYQPNEVARSLSKKRTNIIGILVPSVQHPFFCEVVNYLEFYASKNGYKVMLCVSNHQKEKEAEYIDMLRSNQVAGIVISSRTEDIDQLLDTSMPVVSFERKISNDISAVSCDNYQGGELATKHLLSCGCRHLGHIGGASSVHLPADDRCRAFLDVCRSAGMEGKVFYTEEAQFQSMDYDEYIEHILVENPELDGIFASSDVIAAEIIQACARHNIRVPEDLKIVGFDDIRLASLTTPPITTVHQPIEQMCEWAVDLIVRRQDENVPPARTILGVSLHRRESA